MPCCWNRGTCFRLVSQAAVVMPEWTSRGLIWLVLPKDFARTTLVFFKDLMSVLRILNRCSSPRCVSRRAPLMNLAWVTVDTTSQLVRYHHEPRTIITEDARGIWVGIGGTSAEVAVPLLVNSLILLPTQLLMLMVHLHDLHNWLLHLNLLSSRKLASRWVVRNSQGVIATLTLHFFKLVIIKRRDVVLHVLNLNLVIFLLVCWR